MSPERDDYRDEDEQDEYTPRSIFAAGWFRAALVLTVLAIVVVISLPYLLNWFEPAPPPRVARPADPPPAVKPTPPAPAAVPVPVEPKPAPTAPQPKAAIAPPPAPKPVEKSTARPAETAVAPAPPRTIEPARPAPKAAERRLPEKTTVKAAEAPPAKAAEKADRAPSKTTQAAATRPAEKPVPVRVVKAEAPAQPQVAHKAEAPAPARAQTVAVAKTEAAASGKTAAVAPPKSTSSGSYWIQLGAFKDRENADALAKAVRSAGFAVDVAPITKGAAETSGTAVQQHELFVTDARVEKVNAALKGRGTGQPAAGGIAVKPAFSLQEAMTVSKRLTDEGLKVIIRPAGGPVGTAAPPATLYAVRAGGYPDRSSAVAARDELAGKGHRGFLAEGSPR